VESQNQQFLIEVGFSEIGANSRAFLNKKNKDEETHKRAKKVLAPSGTIIEKRGKAQFTTHGGKEIKGKCQKGDQGRIDPSRL